MSEEPANQPSTGSAPSPTEGGGASAPAGSGAAGSDTGGAAGGEAAAPETIEATAGQFFCEFAAARGFRNCERWREVNPDLAEKPTLEEGDEVVVPEQAEGATSDTDRAEVESVRRDYPPASIRFVGQTSTLGDRTSAGLTRLDISNYQTDKAGLNDHGRSHDFYTGIPAEDEDGRNNNEEEVTTWNDPDHFRVEVHDVTAGRNGEREITVDLQVLQPLYKRVDDSGTTKVQRDEEGRPDPNAPVGFRIPENPARQVNIACKRIGDTNYYRSKYMRLVTETADEIIGHTLFVGDYYQDGGFEGGGGGGAGGGEGAADGGSDDDGPNAGAIAGGAVGGAAVAGGIAAVAVTQTDNELSTEAKVGIVAGSAAAGAVAGGLIGHAASSGGDSDSEAGSAASAAPVATPMTPEEREDTRRYGEILDQKIRARYAPAMCTEEVCRAEAYTEVGQLRAEIRLAVHVFDSGAGRTDYEDVRRTVYGQVRRVYAVAGIRPHLKNIRVVPPPANIIMMGRDSGTGMAARGDTGVAPADGSAAPQSEITVEIDGVEFSIEPTSGQTISQLTTRLNGEIQGHRADGDQVFWTRVVERSTMGALAAGEEGTKYILVFTNADMTQLATVGDAQTDDADFSIGHPSFSEADLANVDAEWKNHEQTVLKACCKTDWFDGLVIKQFSRASLQGIAAPVPLRKWFGPAFIVIETRMKDAPDDRRYTFAHEMGHVVMQCGHCNDAQHNDQLMIKGSLTGGKNAYDIDGRRRLMDSPIQIPYVVITGITAAGAVNGNELTLDGTAGSECAVWRCHQFLNGVDDAMGGATDRVPATEW
ncbi:MAG: hypothetical protein ACYTHJ_03750 [Planctomycetota bacterium]|jgi:hypothetical protein